ncbi:CBO0543 family protein [Paenibacillus hamazuiensis]|uniref:CBO0543 family protein n=1 Tax=Paenibacillus hamazuiensis TaxID=2936508 RepID=UPI00200F8C0F|nr:CBO0543 family protein [Paenibacillus hamazuiensis]
MLFLYISVIVLNAAAYWIPKKLTKQELYITTIFAYVLQWLTDMILDLKYDLYGYFGKGFNWPSLLVVYGIFPAVNILYLNLYPYGRSVGRKVLYIFGWTAFTLLYEVVALKSGWFYYNGWKLWYSAIADPVLFVMLGVHLKIIRRLFYERNG